MTPSLFCVLDPLLDILHGRQLVFQFFRQVAGDLIGADADGLAHVLERILRHEVILALAEQQANRRIVLLFFQDTIHGRKVEVKLSCHTTVDFSALSAKQMHSCYITAARASISSHHTSNTLLAVGYTSAKCASKCCLFKR